MQIFSDAVIPAAGIGKRMGASIPKQYLKLGSLTVLERTCAIFLNDPRISHVIVVVGAEDPIYPSLPLATHPKITTVIGGKERADSVYNGLKAVSAPYVLVHDAARPLLHHEDLKALLEAGFSCADGALLAAKMADTVKQALSNSTKVQVEKTVSREKLWRALTPQMFKTDVLIKAMEYSQKSNFCITDESSAVEAMGLHPTLVECHHPNFKLTDPADLKLAQALMQFEGKL